MLLFLSIGVGQLERRASKLALIAAVAAPVQVAPRPAPAPEAWPNLDAKRDAYRHVTVRGHFLNGRETRGEALTEDGARLRVLTPLRSDAGFVASRPVMEQRSRRALSA